MLILEGEHYAVHTIKLKPKENTTKIINDPLKMKKNCYAHISNEGRHIMLPPKLNCKNNVVRRILTI